MGQHKLIAIQPHRETKMTAETQKKDTSLVVTYIRFIHSRFCNSNTGSPPCSSHQHLIIIPLSYEPTSGEACVSGRVEGMTWSW